MVALLLYTIVDKAIQDTLPTSYQKKQNLLSSHRAADVVVLGSSHALYGILASQMGKDSINLANSSQSIPLDEQLLSKYLSANPAPRFVIEPISYFSLGYMITKGPEDWRDCWYSIYMQVSERSFFQRIADRRYWGMPCLLGAKKLWHVARGIFSDFPTMSLDSSGSSNSATDLLGTPITDDVGLKRAAYHAQLRNEDIQESIESLVRMQKLCQKHGSQLVFVTLPVYKTYSKAMDKQRFYNEIQQVRKIPNTRYFDFLEDPGFTIADFRDNDHLNLQGASKLSRLLWQRCDTALSSRIDSPASASAQPL